MPNNLMNILVCSKNFMNVKMIFKNLFYFRMGENSMFPSMKVCSNSATPYTDATKVSLL